MRHLLALSAVLFLLGATDAHAQFANRSIGASLGFLDLNDAQGLNFAVPLGLHASLYVSDKWEATLHLLGSLVQAPVTQLTGLGGTIQIGGRYLLIEDVIRPYVGAHASFSYWALPVSANNNIVFQYFGVGPQVGVDYFLSDAWSVGFRGQFNLYMQLNQPLNWSYGGALEVSTWY